MYLEAHRAVRLCPWCLRKLAEAKYSRVLPSQVTVRGKFVEEDGACSECGRHMNVFVQACPWCGVAAPRQQHFRKCASEAAKNAYGKPRKSLSQMAQLLKKAE